MKIAVDRKRTDCWNIFLDLLVVKEKEIVQTLKWNIFA